MEFLNKVYNDDFYIYFEIDVIPQYYWLAGVDICPRGCDEECKGSIIASKSCGNDCSQHHKNVERIAKEAFANLWEPNTVVVLWSNVEYSGVFCYGMDGSLHKTVANADALVTPFNTGEYTNFLPVIQVLRSVDEEHMKVNLAHEIAHTLGLQEVRDDFYGDNDGDHKGTDSERCIMGQLDAGEYATVYNSSKPMCDYCVKKLREIEIVDDAYEWDLYTEYHEEGEDE